MRKFEEQGLASHPASWLARQIDVYLDRKRALPQNIEPDHPLFQTAVEARRDLSQIAFALTQLMPIVPSVEMKRQMHRLIE